MATAHGISVRKLLSIGSLVAAAAISPACAESIPDETPATAPDCVGGETKCAAKPPFPAPPGKRWKLTFAEEFNGSGYDRSKLTPCFDWNYGGCTASFNHGREQYDPSQVVVSNGTAKLIATPSPTVEESACQGGSCTYKAGLLSTARPRAEESDYLYKFTYGYLESRLKFPATQGFFTAFWMLPAEPSYQYDTEIDILELLGDDPSTMFMTYHYNGREDSFAVNNGKGDNGACAVKNYAEDFVRVGVDWQSDHISWYIDGERCATFGDASAIEDSPMQLILHMMVDNDWQRRWSVGLTDPTLIRQLEVDYIRVFQQVAE